MCGIAGIFVTARKSGTRRSGQASWSDASRFYRNRNFALGHARLSIIDLACGQQPIHNADHPLCFTSDGEICNYVELRQELIQKGYNFTTHSDTMRRRNEADNLKRMSRCAQSKGLARMAFAVVARNAPLIGLLAMSFRDLTHKGPLTIIAACLPQNKESAVCSPRLRKCWASGYIWLF
jgi:glutamine phosphoribosylpyrophosphate amidotransferase